MRFTAACSEEQRLTHGCAAIWGHAKVRLCLATNWPWRTRRTTGDDMFTVSLFFVSSYSDVVAIYTINSIHVGLWSISAWVESLFCYMFYSFVSQWLHNQIGPLSCAVSLLSVILCAHLPSLHHLYSYFLPHTISFASSVGRSNSLNYLFHLSRFLPLFFSPQLIYKSPHGALLFSPSSALRHDCRSSFTHLSLSLHLLFLSLLPPPPLHLLPAELPDRFVLQWLIWLFYLPT